MFADIKNPKQRGPHYTIKERVLSLSYEYPGLTAANSLPLIPRLLTTKCCCWSTREKKKCLRTSLVSILSSGNRPRAKRKTRK